MLSDESNDDSSHRAAENAEPHVRAQAQHAGKAKGRTDIENSRPDRSKPKGFSGIFSCEALYDQNPEKRAEESDRSEEKGELHELFQPFLPLSSANFVHEGDGLLICGVHGSSPNRSCDSEGRNLSVTVGFEDI